MNNILRGSRLVAAGIIAAGTAISGTVATATAAGASTSAAASTSARASTAARAGTSLRAGTTAAATSPASRLPSAAQMAMLQERAGWAAHSAPAGLGVITGSVVGFDGQPVTGTCVTAVGTGRSITAAAAPDGTFRLAGLPAGSYALEYRDCAAGGRYLTTWSGGAAAQSTAARVQVAAGQVRQVPIAMLRPVNIAAAVAAAQASFRRALAANDRDLATVAASKTGEITGKVTGKGKPLSGVCVEVEPVRSGQGYGATTAKNGSYTIRAAEPGRYHVIFALPFCPGRTNWLTQVYKDDNSPFALFRGGTVVRVRAGRKTAGINGNLRLGGEISGTVTSKSGAKLRGICILAVGSLGHNESFGFEAQTAANGSYHLHALYPGKYSLQFSVGCGSHGSNYAPATRSALKVGLGQHLTVNETLAPGATITGTVTLGSSSGKPLAGICVFAGNASGSVNANAASNHAGVYRVIGLAGGSYQLDFSPGCNNNGNYTSVSLNALATAGKQTSGVNAVLQVGGQISGTLKDTDGNPVTGICIEVVGSNLVGTYEGFDNNGSYVINQLDAGTYQVGFFGGCGNRISYAPNWFNNQPSENTAAPIKLALGQNFPANAVLQPGATISGKVTDAAGNGLSGICVDADTLFDAELGLPISAVPTDTRHGTYRLSNLAPGQYLINFGCGFGRRYADQWFPGATVAGAAHLVSAQAGQTSGINAVLQPPGSISGMVTGPGGHPLAGVCVAGVNAKGALPPLRGTGFFAFAFAGVAGFGGGVPPVTGRHGTYQILGLAAGSYQVSFSPCSGSSDYAEQWYRDKTSSLGATDVTVRAGKTTSGIDGRLGLGGTISGRVIGAAANPLRNICVIAAGQSGGPIGAGVTGKAGIYAIEGLASGRYTVEFSPCGNQNLVTVIAHARVIAPHATTGVNATMHSGGSIAGVVTAGSASGPPVSNGCVEIYSQNSAEPVGFGYTGLDGSYLASGLAAGNYQVYFGDPLCILSTAGLAPQWYNGSSTQAKATPVPVTVSATTSSINAVLQPDGEITGTVSSSSAPSVSGVCVTAVPLHAAGSPRIVAVSRPDGYALADLLPGRYKVEFSSGCGATGYASQWWKDVSSQAAAKVITVVAGQDVSAISAKLSK